MGHPQLWLFLFFCFVQGAQAASCVAQSSADTVALVELYSARNCAGCARAEEWLAGLKSRPPRSVLAVLVPMDERDRQGEPKAWPSRKLSARQRLALTYRPYVVLQGREFPAWDSAAFDAELASIEARAAVMRLRLEIVSLFGERIEVAVEADAPVALYIAGYSGRLGNVPVVQEWQGPFAVDSGARTRRTLPIPGGAEPNNSGVLAFAQDRRSGQVLQAVRLPAC